MNFTAERLAVSFGIAALAALFALAPPAANATCSYPRAPDKIPDGETATKEEMVAAKKEVSRYNEDMNAYLNCIKLESDDQLVELEKQDGEMKTEDEKKAFAARKVDFERKRVQKHNAAVDEVTAVVDRFNEELRAYTKKKQGS